MTTPVWLAKEALLLLHRESLRQFGGADARRDIAGARQGAGPREARANRRRDELDAERAKCSRLEAALKNVDTMLESCDWDHVLLGMICREVEKALNIDSPITTEQE